jgi:hypothetical protein
MKKELSQIEKTALAGYMIVGDEDAAYQCVNPDSKSDKIIFHRMSLRWLRDKRCVSFMNDQRTLMQARARKELEKQIKSNPSGKDLTNKGNVIEELQVLYNAETNAKAKSDILMKIADLERMKQETPKEEEERVHYYLPRKECENCPYTHFHEEGD